MGFEFYSALKGTEIRQFPFDRGAIVVKYRYKYKYKMLSPRFDTKIKRIECRS
jgi:hypothetical protein